MAAEKEVFSVFSELQEEVAHHSRQSVDKPAAVLQAILLVDVMHERLVDICIRGERNVCRQSALENLLRCLVLSILQRGVPRRDWR